MRLFLLLSLASGITQAAEKWIPVAAAVYKTPSEEITLAGEVYDVLDRKGAGEQLKKVIEKVFTLLVADLKADTKMQHQMDWAVLEQTLRDQRFEAKTIQSFHDSLFKAREPKAKPVQWTQDSVIPERKVMEAAIAVAKSRYAEETLRGEDDKRVQEIFIEARRAKRMEEQRKRRSKPVLDYDPFQQPPKVAPAAPTKIPMH